MGFRLHYLRVLMTVTIFAVLATYNPAQAQTKVLNHLKLTLNTGVNFGSVNSATGFPVLRSDLNVSTQRTYTFGGGIQYAIDPAWSIETGYKYSSVFGQTGNFETTLHTASLKNIFNLEQLFVPGTESPLINPYLSLGIGYDFYSYKTSSSSSAISNNSLSYNAGLGLAVKVFRNVDLFSHYEYHLASNRIDNSANSSFKPDILTTLTGGIRINFSSGNDDRNRPTPPINRQPDPYQYTPAPVVEKEKKEEKEEKKEVVEAPKTTVAETTNDGQTESESITRRVENLEESVSRLEQKVDGQGSAVNSQELTRLAQRVENMEMVLQEVQTKLSEVPGNPVVESKSGIAASIPLGNYVQVFASDKLSSVQRVREDVISSLGNRLNGTSHQVFITRRGKFYQVLIGKFNSVDKAGSVKEIVSGTYSDAFIINFPRPLSLQPLYEGMKRIR